MPATRLVLGREARAAIEDAACAGHPLETCGLLIGERRGQEARVREAAPARNRAADPRRRYDVDPVDQMRAEERARELGLEVVGVWHSHPDQPARPSETDRAAAWEGYSYLIVSVAGGRAREARSWRLADGAFVEESVLTP